MNEKRKKPLKMRRGSRSDARREASLRPSLHHRSNSPSTHTTMATTAIPAYPPPSQQADPFRSGDDPTPEAPQTTTTGQGSAQGPAPDSTSQVTQQQAPSSNHQGSAVPTYPTSNTTDSTVAHFQSPAHGPSQQAQPSMQQSQPPSSPGYSSPTSPGAPVLLSQHQHQHQQSGASSASYYPTYPPTSSTAAGPAQTGTVPPVATSAPHGTAVPPPGQQQAAPAPASNYGTLSAIKANAPPATAAAASHSPPRKVVPPSVVRPGPRPEGPEGWEERRVEKEIAAAIAAEEKAKKKRWGRRSSNASAPTAAATTTTTTAAAAAAPTPGPLAENPAPSSNQTPATSSAPPSGFVNPNGNGFGVPVASSYGGEQSNQLPNNNLPTAPNTSSATPVAEDAFSAKQHRRSSSGFKAALRSAGEKLALVPQKAPPTEAKTEASKQVSSMFSWQSQQFSMRWR